MNGNAELSRGWRQNVGTATPPRFYGSIYLGNFHCDSMSKGQPVTVYRFTVFDGCTLLHDFVPVKNASGVAGVYDTVGNLGFRSAANVQHCTAGAVFEKGMGTDQQVGLSIGDSLFSVTTTEIALPVSGQCVTSVAVDPRDANKVVVTCGNYGNDAYVFYATNALADEPTFVSKQGNLPKMPVYSSLIEMTTGDVILGTERGIYRTKDIAGAQWTADTYLLGEVPVMELKQQILFEENKTVVIENEEGTMTTVYPGIYNTGVIYAATYGRGVFRCENYKKEFTSVPETPSVEGNINVNIYPNPVSSQAIVSFDLSESCDVNYQVFDMTGRMLMNQTLGRMSQGNHQININAENLSTGSYILRISQGAKNETVKFMVY